MKSTFLAENRTTIARDFCAVHVTPAAENDGGNDDGWRITINTADNGGQQMEVGKWDVDYVSFVVRGGQELMGILDALPEAIERAANFPAVYLRVRK
jgi:hypothetical protein